MVVLNRVYKLWRRVWKRKVSLTQQFSVNTRKMITLEVELSDTIECGNKRVRTRRTSCRTNNASSSGGCISRTPERLPTTTSRRSRDHIWCTSESLCFSAYPGASISLFTDPSVVSTGGYSHFAQHYTYANRVPTGSLRVMAQTPHTDSEDGEVNRATIFHS